METNQLPLIGKTLIEIKVDKGFDDEIIFTVDDGTKYKMYHRQNCCEGVKIDDIVGDLSDLIGSPILKAEESTQDGDTESGTEKWTFYHFATIKGYVDLKWYGSSNGNYSEGVDFELIEE